MLVEGERDCSSALCPLVQCPVPQTSSVLHPISHQLHQLTRQVHRNKVQEEIKNYLGSHSIAAFCKHNRTECILQSQPWDRFNVTFLEQAVRMDAVLCNYKTRNNVWLFSHYECSLVSVFFLTQTPMQTTLTLDIVLKYWTAGTNRVPGLEIYNNALNWIQ